MTSLRAAGPDEGPRQRSGQRSGERPRRWRRAAAVATAGAALLAAALLTTPTHAAPGMSEDAAPASGGAQAQLEQVTGFGSNPGNLTMHRYVPDDLPAGSPVVLLLHGCAQGPVEYFDHSGWRGVADAGGFTVIAAGQQTANNASRCFNWFEPADTARGSGETLSLKQMVDRVLADQGADANRVFVTGLSAGGGMTATMLAAYPDVFAGGAVVAGLPHGCARSMIEAFSCMSPGKNQSPQAWGDLVRAAHPGHSGARPPVSIWHGGQDYVVATANLTESVKQWTDAHGIDQTPDATSALPQSTTRSEYHDSSGRALVTTYLMPGNGHGTPIDPPSCGASGSYFLPGLCSASYMAQDWGIATGGGDPTDPSDPTDPTDPRRRRRRRAAARLRPLDDRGVQL
ncbi:extracellular catalytic domain type 1 short-chain-length polyhydroxyalkanoate depolymerase, partial [Streptomyces otsuchiensis]|uniref:extracellular catalytic domain type 1 short-chain-length polyhydroxyalkanoate depolymerase n=1 Tax=Streptomyces otsuchiensis TaxID=2681388 RepID=UPI001D130808